MRSESGMGRSRNLLTPWAHRKRNTATVKITDQTVSTAHEGKLWTWFNLLQHVSELREARTACRKRRLSLRSRPRGCAAAQRLCWPALAHKHEVKKERFALWAALFIFFFSDTSATADQTVRKTGLTASTRGTITSAAPMCSHFVGAGVSLRLPAHELFSENITNGQEQWSCEEIMRWAWFHWLCSMMPHYSWQEHQHKVQKETYVPMSAYYQNN